ncbi:phospholipase D1 [Echria macrotheca]|uniref:Phospholipase D1 n=1 Tax=Echria macrotheca TaxID=438768 RepID=A0AAJ0F158_9PEZI|nr:phospholipase D1 [Echria macrotheca]
MADSPRTEAGGSGRQEMTMASGRLTELPTIPQARALGMPSPIGSDQYDFATKPGSLRGQTLPENKTVDYINSGIPHDRIAPISDAILSPRPPGLNTDLTSNSLPPPITLETPETSSPTVPRRSVQFARDDVVSDPPLSHSRQGSWDARDPFGKFRGSTFMAKLKEFTGSGASQSYATPTMLGELGSTTSSPTVTRHSTRAAGTADEGSDVDADAEETADETTASGQNKGKQKKKRRMKRPRLDSYSTPNTPHMASMSPDTPVAHHRLNFLRRATAPEIPDHAGVSEGEGRDRLTREQNPRRPAPWAAGGRSAEGEEAESPSGRGMSHHFRRFSALGGGASDGDAVTPRRPLFGGERATTFGAQKWRQVKNTLKLLRRKEDERFDYYKSAELMAELRAVAPAVLILASMIQRDEHGNKRIPVLLEQLRLHIRDSTPVEEKDSERHWLFTIELEYGSGPSQMKWTIKRTIRDFLNLHWKYKLTLRNEKFTTTRLDLGAKRKQPRFPLSAFPYLRGVRGLDENDDEDPADIRAGDETAAEGTAGEATVPEVTDAEERPPMRKRKSRMPVLGPRRKSSALGSTADLNQSAAESRRKYVERQQRMLEKYLQEMIHWLMFRADSNRLCRFLELSALGVRLAAEGSYHGKECYLHIQSSQGLDFRRVLTPGKVIARHSRKWFLVRQSYIVCVESPENMNIYDVYLVDPKFEIVSKKNKGQQLVPKSNEGADDIENLDLTARRTPTKHHTLKIITSERMLRLFSPNQHIMQQFEESVQDMLSSTPWHRPNRFESFAPVRTGVHAQWLVDGRDYMWNVSRAISMAKDVIYIHDWWLSPELYMRRPACISQKWRLDRLLQRKAEQGVKIFVIVYRNVEAAVPIDSEYTKFSLLNLHPNIFVQRSPNQFKKNQFFFAHHEKIVIVDHDIAFVGGIDLCFGRWDCPQHPVADDKPTGFESLDTPKDAEHCQLFPGKDYSNPRVQDFFKLNEPYEEMYDRGKVPRMPWHDISMQVVGQPARDLTRHFVQRWNYVRRGRKPTRPTPFLLPPPDSKQEEIKALGLEGTCEVQILRSASTWSLGVEETEHSIQSAYIKMIEDSEHFVYMENQFFITSTDTMNTRMVNRIGDALVSRIIRAHENDEDWRAVILIPLMPGFQNEVNVQDGTSVRLILQCQFRSICRGEHSIFGRLRAAGIDPENYIQFFSLRQWGKLGNGTITTEQLYIHAKCIIVDDRVALIGSANINERSMLGNRDSECAAIVRDTDMIWSTMGGRPYQVGRFAHTLRLRLMREHLGLDVDQILEEERQLDNDRSANFEDDMDRIYHDEPEASAQAGSSKKQTSGSDLPSTPTRSQRSMSFNHDIDLAEPEPPRGRSRGKSTATEEDTRGIGSEAHRKEVEGFGPDRWKAAQEEGADQGRDSVIINGREVLVHDISPEGRGTLHSPHRAHKPRRLSGTAPLEGGSTNDPMPPMPAFDRRTTEQLGLPRASQLPSLPMMDDTDIGGPPAAPESAGNQAPSTPHPLAADIKLAAIDKDCMRDPLNDNFYENVWCRAAENNTKIYRRVFRVMPDSEVTNWTEYKEFDAYNKRFKDSMDGARTSEEGDKTDNAAQQQSTAGAGIGAPGPAALGKGLAEKMTEKVPNALLPGSSETPRVVEPPKDSAVDEKKALAESAREEEASGDIPTDPEKIEGGGGALNPNLNAGEDIRPSSAATSWLEVGHDARKERRPTFSTPDRPDMPPNSSGGGSASGVFLNGSTTEVGGTVKSVGSQRRRQRAATRSSRRGFSSADEILSRAEAEELLNLMQGTLVQFPYDWLLVEETNGNWLFQVDQVAPLQIYN